MRRFCLLVGLVGILGGAIPAFSQRAQNAQPPFQQEIVVTASLEEEAAAEAPATVTIFNAEEIERRQATTVLELLGTVPGVSTTQSGSPGSVASVFTRGTNSTHTLALWNGIPLNDPFFGGYDWAFLPTDGAVQVEVVRGPLSILYGSDALGGVVNVITGRQAGLGLRLEGGEQNYARGAFTGGFDLGSGGTHLDLIAVGRIGEAELENDFYDGWDGTVRLLHALRGQDWRFGAVIRMQDAEVGIPRDGAILTPRRRQEQAAAELALPVSGRVGKHWGLELLLSRRTGEFTFRDPDAFFDLNDTEAERLRARGVATHDGLLASEGWFAFGTEWHREEVDNLSTFGTNLDGARRRTWAAFAQARQGWERVSLAVGVRHDDNDALGSEVSPHLAVTWSLPRAGRLRASYGEAFRAPSLGELFFPFSGNPRLEPERSESYELSWQGEAGPWRWQGTAFEIRQEDLIQFDPVTFTNVNIGRAKSRGVEAEVGYVRGPWRLRANATLLEAEDRNTGEPLLRRPEESGNLVLTYSPDPWAFNLVARYVGERPDVDPVTFATRQNESYIRLDLAVHWRAFQRLSPRWTPYARVENLADEEYQEALGFPAPGRTFVGGVGLRF